MTIIDTPDAELLRAYAATRDAEAFAVLVERHARMVYAVCRRIVGEERLAEDACQESFLALARQASQVRESVAAWLHAVARRTAVGLVRQRERQPRSVATVYHGGTDELGQLQRHVDEALDALPSELRSVLVLRFLEQRSQQEIACQLGISQPTVSRRLTAALTQLRTLLADSTPAVALPAALAGLPAPALPPTLGASLGKLSLGTSLLAGAASSAIGATLVAVVAAVLLVAATAAKLTITSTDLAPELSAMPDDDDRVPADPAAGTMALLELPITLQLRRASPETVLDALPAAVRTQGRWCWLSLPWARSGEEPLIDCVVEQRPLREVLDLLAARWQAQWHSDGSGGIAFARHDPERARQLLERLARVADLRHVDDVARQCVASGDPVVLRGMLHQLARSPQPSPQRLDRNAAIIAALRPACGYFDAAMLDVATPLPLDDAARAALAGDWQDRAGAAVTPFHCLLMGLARVPAARERLRAIVADPASVHWAGEGAPGARLRMLTAGMSAVALSLLDDQEASAAVLALLQDPELAAIHPWLRSALGRLAVPEAVSLLQEAAWSDRRAVAEGAWEGLWQCDPVLFAAVANRGTAAERHARAGGAWRWFFMNWPSEPMLDLWCSAVGASEGGEGSWHLVRELIEGGAALPPAARERIVSLVGNPLADIAAAIAAARWADGDWDRVWELALAGEHPPQWLAIYATRDSGSDDGAAAALRRRFAATEGASIPLLRLVAHADLADCNRRLLDAFDRLERAQQDAVLSGLRLSTDPAVCMWIEERLRTAPPAELPRYVHEYRADRCALAVLALLERDIDDELRASVYDAIFNGFSDVAAHRLIEELSKQRSIDFVRAVGHYGIWAWSDTSFDQLRAQRLLVHAWASNPMSGELRSTGLRHIAEWAFARDAETMYLLHACIEATHPRRDADERAAAAETLARFQAIEEGRYGRYGSSDLWHHALMGSYDDPAVAQRMHRMLAEHAAKDRAREGGAEDF